MTTDDLTQPCPVCTAIREAYDRAWELAIGAPQIALRDEAVCGSGDRVDCGRCQNRLRILTDDGKKLIAFVRGWLPPNK